MTFVRKFGLHIQGATRSGRFSSLFQANSLCRSDRLRTSRVLMGAQTRQKRVLSHHPPFPYPEIPSAEAAKSFAVHLDQKSRTLLLSELMHYDNVGTEGIPDVNRQQLWHVFMFNGVPFIGFGILDNMIMIVAGEYIDITIGAALGISTMAAAALGNLISDVAGVGTAGYVELLASKMGVSVPDITPAQARQWQVRWGVGLGRAVGITIGCIIGMFPLLFFIHDDDDDSKNVTSDEQSSTNVVS